MVRGSCARPVRNGTSAEFRRDDRDPEDGAEGCAPSVADEAVDGEVLPPAPERLTLAERNELGAAAGAAHAAVERAGKDMVKHARATGAILIKAKAGIPHGEFQRWLDRDAGIKHRTAQAYMKLARELPSLPPANVQRVARLSLRDAMAELSRTSSKAAHLPPPALDRALAEARRNPLKKALAGAANDAHDRPTVPATVLPVKAPSAASEPPDPPTHGKLVRIVLAQAEAYQRSNPGTSDADLLAVLDEAGRQIRAGAIATAPIDDEAQGARR